MHLPTMQNIPIRRDKPFIWVTWLAKLLFGSNQCKWSVWHRAHFDYNKRPDKDWTESNIKHTAIRTRLLEDLENRDCDILLEREVLIDDPNVTIKGKIDALIVKDDRGMVFEVKSGKKSNSDRAQLMIYMWMIKRAYKRYQDVLFDGMLVYDDVRTKIAVTEINEDFNRTLTDLIRSIIHEEPPRKYPSHFECQWCNIADCDERVTSAEIDEPSDNLPNFV